MRPMSIGTCVGLRVLGHVQSCIMRSLVSFAPTWQFQSLWLRPHAIIERGLIGHKCLHMVMFKLGTLSFQIYFTNVTLCFVVSCRTFLMNRTMVDIRFDWPRFVIHHIFTQCFAGFVLFSHIIAEPLAFSLLSHHGIIEGCPSLLAGWRGAFILWPRSETRLREVFVRWHRGWWNSFFVGFESSE